MKITLKSVSVIVGIIISIGTVCVATGVFIGNTKSTDFRIEEKITIFAEINKNDHDKIDKSLNKINDKLDVVIDKTVKKTEIAKGE